MMMIKRRAFGDGGIGGCGVSISQFKKLADNLIGNTNFTLLFPFLYPNCPNPRLPFHSSAAAAVVAANTETGRIYGSRLLLLTQNIIDINNVEDAVGLCKRMLQMRPMPVAFCFTQLLGRVVKMGHYSTAISLYRDICSERTAVNEHTMTIVINCCCLVGRVDFGFSVLGAFYKRGFVPNVVTFTTLLRGHFRRHMVNEAEDLFKKIIHLKLCQMNEVIFGTVISGLCKVGKTSIAIEFLRDMECANCTPNQFIYNSIINSLCKAKMVDKALSLLQEMIDKGIAPDVVNYNCLIHGLCNLGKWEDVKKLWNEMIGFGIAPDTVTYSIMIVSFCKAGLMNDARDVLEIMVQRGVNPTIVTYNSLMDGYCLQGLIDEARQVFDTLVDKGLQPDIVSYGILINGYLKEMKMDEAMNLFRKIP